MIISLADITEKKPPPANEEINWLGDVTDLYYRKVFSSIEKILGVRKANGVVMQNRSAVSEFVQFNVAEKNGGKTDKCNYDIEWALNNICNEEYYKYLVEEDGEVNYEYNEEMEWVYKKYGTDLVSIYVTRDLFAVTGIFVEEEQRFFGSLIDDKPIQIIVHDDTLSQFGNKASSDIINEFTKIFQNTRHLSKCIDPHGNKRGRFIFYFNCEDYYNVHVDIRRNYNGRNFKTLQKNKQHYREFKREIPEEGIEILTDITDRIVNDEVDQSFKSQNIIDFGFGNWGLVMSGLAKINYCDSDGPYWVDSIDLEELYEEMKVTS